MSVRQPNAGPYGPYGDTDHAAIDGDIDATTYPSFISFRFIFSLLLDRIMMDKIAKITIK